MLNQHQLKTLVAKKALEYVSDDDIIGVGTGSTINLFIEELSTKRIKGAVASSQATARALERCRIAVYDIHEVDSLSVYIDGADQINHCLHMIKGGGGALTGEKILGAVASQFICIADESKFVSVLGEYPLPVEVVPMARSYVARQLVRLGGRPRLRSGTVVDTGNVILDVHGLNIAQPVELEDRINQITGVVTCGLFARRHADVLLLGRQSGVDVIR